MNKDYFYQAQVNYMPQNDASAYKKMLQAQTTLQVMDTEIKPSIQLNNQVCFQKIEPTASSNHFQFREFQQQFQEIDLSDTQSQKQLFLKVLASVDLPADEQRLVQEQMDQGSSMVSMIFKFYLQSGEHEFFIRRLKNLVASSKPLTAYTVTRAASTQESLMSESKYPTAIQRLQTQPDAHIGDHLERKERAAAYTSYSQPNSQITPANTKNSLDYSQKSVLQQKESFVLNAQKVQKGSEAKVVGQGVSLQQAIGCLMDLGIHISTQSNHREQKIEHRSQRQITKNDKISEELQIKPFSATRDICVNQKTPFQETQNLTQTNWEQAKAYYGSPARVPTKSPQKGILKKTPSTTKSGKLNIQHSSSSKKQSITFSDYQQVRQIPARPDKHSNRENKRTIMRDQQDRMSQTQQNMSKLINQVNLTTEIAQKHLQTSFPRSNTGQLFADDFNQTQVRPWSVNRDTEPYTDNSKYYQRLEYGIANTDREQIGSGLIASLQSLTANQPQHAYTSVRDSLTQRHQFVRGMYQKQ